MQDLMTPDELAARWDTTRQGLASMRYRGNGPRFVKIGRRIFYRVADVSAYEAAQVRQITGEKVPA